MVNEQITLGSVISWDNDPGAAQTHVVVLDSSNGMQIGEATVAVPENSIDVLQFLTGRNVGTYVFRFSSIDGNSNEGSNVEIHYDYVAPNPPTNIVVS